MFLSTSTGRRGMDVITIDEGFNFGMSYSNAKAATFAARPVFDRQPTPTEMFWFLFHSLTESDPNKNVGRCMISCGMSRPQLLQTTVLKKLLLNKNVQVTMEPRRGDKRSKEVTQQCNTAHLLRMCTVPPVGS